MFLQSAQFSLDKGADVLDGAASLRQHARIKLEDMEHARPDFEIDRRAGGPQPLGHAHGVVAKELVAPDLHEDRGQPRSIAI